MRIVIYHALHFARVWFKHVMVCPCYMRGSMLVPLFIRAGLQATTTFHIIRHIQIFIRHNTKGFRQQNATVKVQTHLPIRLPGPERSSFTDQAQNIPDGCIMLYKEEGCQFHCWR